MKKPTSLRAALSAALPELRNSPDRLSIWIEDGAVRARQTETHGFAFVYPMSVLLREVSTDIAIVTHAINRWLRVNQPDLLAGGGGDSFSFETDILDNGTADILFSVRLVENVAIAPQEDGSWSIEYLAEPDPLFGDDDAIAPNTGAPPLAGATLEFEPTPGGDTYPITWTPPVTIEEPPPSGGGDDFDLRETDW